MVDSSMAVPQSLQRGPTSMTSDLGLRPSSSMTYQSQETCQKLPLKGSPLPAPLFPNKKNTHPKWWKKGRNLLKIQTHIKDVHKFHSHLDPRFSWLALIGEIGPFSTRVVWQWRHSGRRSRFPRVKAAAWEQRSIWKGWSSLETSFLSKSL